MTESGSQGEEPPSSPPAPAPAPAPAPMLRTSGRATAVLVLGIVGLCFSLSLNLLFGVASAIVALRLAPRARREIASSGGWVVGAKQVKTGVRLAWAAIVISVLVGGLALQYALVSRSR